MSGTVYKIISSRRPHQPEKAQIAVDVTDHWHRELRIENTLTDEYGDDMRLEKGAHVEVTVTAEPDVNRTRLAAVDFLDFPRQLEVVLRQTAGTMRR